MSGLICTCSRRAGRGRQVVPGGLLTGLYELNMTACYLRRSVIG